MGRELGEAVASTVSGVLGGRPGEGAEPPPDTGAGSRPAVDGEHPAPPEPAEPALPQTGESAPALEEPAVIETAPEPTSAEAGPAPAADTVSPAADPVTPADAPADPVLAAAVDVARAAAVEVGGRAVGDHLGAVAEGPGVDGPVVAHSFATTDPAYVGWRWVVSLARAEGSDVATVDEVVLLPGADALLAPSWLPWSERVQPADLSPGDLLPTAADDPRLVPAYVEVDLADPDADAGDAALAEAVTLELGLGRPRVLSLEGRLDAAERWWTGDAGPDSPMAKQAPAQCVDCGFLVPLAGGLRQAFGVCANALAPDDGRVVALAHGCGAHSETVVDAPHAATAGLVVEDDEFELLPTQAAGRAEAAADAEPQAGSDADAEPQAGSEADAEPRAGSDADAEPQVEIDVESEPQAQVEADVDAAEPEVEMPQAEVEMPQPEVEAAQPEVEGATEPQPEA